MTDETTARQVAYLRRANGATRDAEPRRRLVAGADEPAPKTASELQAAAILGKPLDDEGDES